MKNDDREKKTGTTAAGKCVPRLRFSEFRNDPEWEKKRLEKIFKERNQKNLPEKQILAATQDRGVIPYELLEKSIVRERDNLVGYKLVLKGDFVISLRSFEGGFEYSDYEGIISPAYTIIFLTENESEAFFRFYFKRNSFICTIQTILNSSLRDGKSINYKQAALLPLFFPKRYAEQQKIADCLASVDTLISLYTNKLDSLKDYKKGLMQQLFPADGQHVPRLRFPEFKNAPEWEEKKLSDICFLQAGDFISASKIYKNKIDKTYPCFGGNGLRGYTKIFTHSGTYPLIGRQGALCGNVTLARGQFYATEHAVTSTPKEGVDVVWLFYQLLRLNLNQYATGQAQPGLSVKQLEQIILRVSVNVEEQQKIAGCLSSIDDLISAETKKVQILQGYKEGQMQQLFPAVNNK
jgi:type I restriction enzyme, S subunit